MNRKKWRRSACGAAALAAAALIFTGCARDIPPQTTAPEQTVQTTAPTEASATTETTLPTGLSLPLQIGQAGLEIRECFSSSIPNPDAGDEMADNVASLEIVNCSGRYLEHIYLTLETSDERTFTFRLRDLPADGVVWAFDLENQPLADGAQIRAVSFDQLQFGQPDPSLQAAVTARAEDLTVTLTNTGSETLENLEVVCRCNFGEQYFGGISYCYPVPSLAPGGQVSIDAAECYMGTAEVVAIRPAP